MIKSFMGKSPKIDGSAFIAENATIIGDAVVGKDSSVWYGAVIRGDISPITVGDGTNIQDNAVLHCSAGLPLTIGNNVTVGHSAVVHCSEIGDNVLIGMGAILLDRCVVGRNSIIAAGAVLLEGSVVPENTLMVGVPAKAVRTFSPEQAAEREKLTEYVKLSKLYLEEEQNGQV